PLSVGGGRCRAVGKGCDAIRLAIGWCRTMLLYAVTKLVAYCGWCLLGLRLLAPAHATLGSAVRYGSLRWLLGLGFGLAAAIALGSVSRESVATLFPAVYAPLRVVAWASLSVASPRR